MIDYYHLNLTGHEAGRLEATQIVGEDDWEMTLCPAADFSRPDRHFYDGYRLRTDLAVQVDHSKRTNS